MNWRFTIYDRNNTATVIDEPVGWDNNTSEIKRDAEWHGIFFTNQGDTFEFYDEAMHLLKDEWEQYGFAGSMSLGIEEDCGSGYEEFIRSRFDFNKYDFVCDSGSCYVKIPTEKTGEVVELRNRLNQKVNLETALAFDEVTALPPYNMLPYSMELPSKAILIQDYAINEGETREEILGIASGGANESEYGMISLGFNKTKAAEVGGFNIETSPLYDFAAYGSNGTMDGTHPAITLPNPDGDTDDSPTQVWPLFMSPTVNYAEGFANYGDVSNPCQLNYYLNAKLEVMACDVNCIQVVLCRLPLANTGEHVSHYEWLAIDEVYNILPFISPNPGPGTIININKSYNSNAFNLNPGDRLYWFISIYHRKVAAQYASNAFKLTVNNGSYFHLTSLSKTPATVSKVFAINEVISRVAETITNNRLKAYSEYFGRTDSQPYSHPADGCGSLELVTDGIRIRRQENKIPGTTNLFTLSLQDIFEGLSPIHNIGMGLEADTARPGYNRLRVEPWNYFYNNTVVMSCIGVNKITRRAYEKEAYSTFQFGYAKWEAEEYTGLDEFLTKRTYRTTIGSLKNDLVKLSKWIASGYAWEVTRRKGNLDSKDWRYDKETFIVCATRVKKYRVRFYTIDLGFVVLYRMRFETNTDGSEFLIGSITIAGSLYNNGTRSIFGQTLSTLNGITTVDIGFSTGIIVPEESYTVTFPGVASPPGLFVEQGNVLNPANIIDPASLYNYRISPIRNAMRWMNRVLETYRQFNVDAKVVFTDGDGNYFALGQQESSDCKIENGIIGENETIDLTRFADSDIAKPFLMPERVVYEYPMSSQEYKNVEANPYGLIYFENDCEDGFGFIDTIQYKPEAGLATFTLIPKVT